MTTTDTTVSNLIINKLTQEQYEAITTPSATELYLTTDGAISSSDVTTALGYTPQAELVSGTSIKTINSTSLLGSGNISISDTKNTAGSSNSSSKLYLIGATSQATNAVTYSKTTIYANTDGTLNCENPASTKNDTTVATTKWVKDLGYTTNTGTVTSVNNVSPVNGNVTLSIPSEVTETTVTNWGFTKNTGTVTSVNSTSPDANGNVTLSIPTQASDISALDTNASNLTATGQKVFDGQWVISSASLVEGANAVISDANPRDISTYLPVDNYNYEVIVTGTGFTGTTAGNQQQIILQTDVMTSDVYMWYAVTRTNSAAVAGGTATLVVGANRKIQVRGYTYNTGTYSLYLRGYRRIGTNS